MTAPAPIPYLDVPTFTTLTEMPVGDVQSVVDAAPGYIEARIALEQSRMNARLRKRYSVPFNQNGGAVPDVVQGWLTAIVTPAVYRKRGVQPATEDQVKRLDELADAAIAEITEAANSQTGLFDLPLAEGATPGQIDRGEPLGESYASPYVATYSRDARAFEEDWNGRR